MSPKRLSSDWWERRREGSHERRVPQGVQAIPRPNMLSKGATKSGERHVLSVLTREKEQSPGFAVRRIAPAHGGLSGLSSRLLPGISVTGVQGMLVLNPNKTDKAAVMGERQ